ncbi:adhesion G-protein coupled receptor G2 isoform X2 [Engraulis encrasicolus]|uniref:adhesion G-protein coupled receptor G2 isoform X2 n=1 Tax=Engraulis encrasicolus TaxID=184585 RepID=UPI002FCF08EF
MKRLSVQTTLLSVKRPAKPRHSYVDFERFVRGVREISRLSFENAQSMDGGVPAKGISEVDERDARANRWMASWCVAVAGQRWPLSSAMCLLITLLLLVSPLTVTATTTKAATTTNRSTATTTTTTTSNANQSTPATNLSTTISTTSNVTTGHDITTLLPGTTSNTTPPSNATDFYYWMVLHVEVIGSERNESNVTEWLEDAFRSHLDACETPDVGPGPSTAPPLATTPNHSTNMTSSPALHNTSRSTAASTVTTASSSTGTNGTSVTSTSDDVTGPRLRSNSLTSPLNTTSSPLYTSTGISGHSTAVDNTTDNRTDSVFQEMEVCCKQKQWINRTVCSVVVKLSAPRSPCCFRHALWNASRTKEDEGKIFASIQNNTVKSIAAALHSERPNATSNSTYNCTSVGGQQTDQSANNCSAEFEDLEETCNCSRNCDKTDVYYYAMSLRITNSSINITSMLSIFKDPPSCNNSVPDCKDVQNVAEVYKDGYGICSNNSFGECVVIVELEEKRCGRLWKALESVFKSVDPDIKIGRKSRVALCGVSPEHAKTFLWEEVLIKGVNVTTSEFCDLGPAVFNSLYTCQPGSILLVRLKQPCGGGGGGGESGGGGGSGSSTSKPPTPPRTTLSTTTSNTTTTRPATANSTTTTPSGGLGTDTTRTSTTPTTKTTTQTSLQTTVSATTAPVSTTTLSGDEQAANALLDLTKNVSSLTSADVERLVGQLETLLQGPTVSETLGRTSVNIVSNLLDAAPDVVASSATRLIRIVDTVGLKLVFTQPTVQFLFESLALAVQKVDGTNFKQTTISIADPQSIQISDTREKRSAGAAGEEKRVDVPQGSITLPATLTDSLSPQQQLEASRLQFNFYQQSTLFQDASLLDRNLSLTSGILSTSVANLSISNLTDSIIITLRSNNTEGQENKTQCVFWDFTLYNNSGGWNTNGCTVLNVTDNQTICSCSHLTSFGILLDISGTGPTSALQARILSYITYIGCGISSIFLSITLLTYLAFGKLRKDIPSKILIQLCFALLFLNLTFLLDAWLALYEEAVGLCISTAWFLHYFLLAAFTWMGLEAVHMYIALVKVFNSYVSRFMLKFSLVGWGVPMAVVIIVIAIDKDNYGLVSYGDFEDAPKDEFCWLKNRVAFYVAVVAYFCVVFLMNLAMFIVVLVQLGRIKRQNPHNVLHRSRLQDARSIAGLTVLLGLTWGFAFFAWGVVNLPFMYLFAILNSFQGLFIFIFHCAVKENVRRQWRTYLCCGKLRLAENSDWSRTATQNKNRITSMISSKSTKSSNSQNSNTSSSYVGMDLSIRTRSTRSPTEENMISDTDSNSDVVHNEINHQHHNPARSQVSWGDSRGS